MAYLGGFTRLKENRDQKVKDEAKKADQKRAFKERYKQMLAQQYMEEEKAAMQKVQE